MRSVSLWRAGVCSFVISALMFATQPAFSDGDAVSPPASLRSPP